MHSIARHSAFLILAGVAPLLLVSVRKEAGGSVTGPPSYRALSITPQGDTTSVNPFGTSLQVFEVVNNGAAATFNYVATCVGPAVASGCTPNLTSSFIASGGAKLVKVSYTGSGNPGDTARVYLTAFDGPPTTARDSGYVRLTVKGGLVAVSPHTGSQSNVTPNQSGRFAEFTVSNPGNMTANTAINFTCVGAAVSGCTVSASALTIAAGGSAKDTVYYTSGNFSTTGSIKLVATLGTNPVLADSGVIQVATTVATIGDSVVPDGGLQTNMPASSAQKAVFTVHNTGTVQSTYTLSVNCSTAPVSGGCTLSPSSLTIPGGQSKPDTVSFTTGAAGSAGRMIFTATVQGSNPVVKDTGWVDLSVQGPSNQGAPIINVQGLNSRTSVDRSQCLTIAVAANAAAECGDLLVMHPLPTLRTMNAVRTPMLAYRSNHGEPVGQVSINTTILSATAIPDSVIATLTVAGVQKARQAWPGSEWTSIRTRRIASWYPDLSGISAIVPYQLTVGNKYGGTTYLSPAITDTLIIVSRLASPFGAGWWVSGVEELSTATMLWVGGDGSARYYRTVNSTTWVADTLAYPDMIKKVGTEYWRLLPDSARVVFDANGKHIKTVNRLGHETTLYWGGTGKLDSIAPPIRTLGVRLRWRFHYFNNDSVEVNDDWGGAPRSTKIYKTVLTTRTDSIRDPDGKVVRFRYMNIPQIALLDQRTDKRGTQQQFQYSGYGKLYHTDLAPGSGQEAITHDFWMAENQGLAESAVPASVDTALVATYYDGPRASGVGDTLRVWVTRFGAPKRIRDANGFNTHLLRGNGAFPALVTRLQTPIGRVMGAVYDGRGRITSVTDSSWSNATTRYSWDSKWDALTGIRRPAGDRDTMVVDANTGNRTWQQDGRGDTTRVNFSYNATTRQLIKILGPGSPYHELGYDFQGNLNRVGDTLNLATTHHYNTRGELLSTHVDSANVIFSTDSMVYDQMSRDTLVRKWAIGDTIIVRKTWDNLARRSMPLQLQAFPTTRLPRIAMRWSELCSVRLGSSCRNLSYAHLDSEYNSFREDSRQ